VLADAAYGNDTTFRDIGLLYTVGVQSSVSV
jgi:SRSO17 transposase